MTREEANALFEQAWERMLIQNEWFDGEQYLLDGSRRALVADFRQNAPSRVTFYPEWGARGEPRTVDFPTRLAAEAHVASVKAEPYFVHVKPIG